MSLISATDLAFQAGSKPLFEGLSFHINPGDRVGLVGHNGSGKSTLLKLMLQKDTPDSGSLSFRRNLNIGLVEQFLDPELEARSAIDAVAASLGPDRCTSEAYRAHSVLEKLGIDSQLADRVVGKMSGGQKNLIAFARSIVRDPDLLLLDEPGNHMDSLAMSHLQRYLSGVGVPAFVMISHDRDLLDSVTHRTLWLRDQRCYGFTLPYSQARTALAEQDEANLKAREEEEKEIAQLKVSARRLATWGKVYDNKKLARKAKTMEKRVGKLEESVTFVSKGSGLSLEVDAELTKSKQLFAVNHEQVCAPDMTPLFSIEELVFRPGDRVALLGVNGTGKSSFIKALLRHFDQELDTQTSVRFNPNVRIGYFDQELAHFDSPAGIADWVTDHCTTQEEFAKRTLISWGFPYADHQRPVKVLSGGERARLLLLTFQLEQPNLLIMDEPTNHIDLQGKEELEHDLAKPGISLLFTSHDRRFIESTATRYWWIRDGMLTEIHDPEPYFESMLALDAHGPGSTQTERETSLCDPTDTLDEDCLLERICELEELISQDKGRKPKFQKPAKQEAWQEELEQLMGRLSAMH